MLVQLRQQGDLKKLSQIFSILAKFLPIFSRNGELQQSNHVDLPGKINGRMHKKITKLQEYGSKILTKTK